MLRRLLPVLLVIAALGLLAACGEKDEPPEIFGGSDEPEASSTTTSTTSTTSTETVPEESVAEETADALPPLPKGWTPEINFDGGFELGVPPGWNAENEGVRSVYTSPDDLIAVTVSADRSPGALALPLDEFALRTSEALGGSTQGGQRYKDLVVGQAVPFEHQYEASAVRSKGVPVTSDVLEKALVVVIKREEFAVYVVIVRQNAEVESKFADRDTIKDLIRSLRGRPPA